MSKNETNINFLFKSTYSKLIEFFLANPDNEFYVNEILKAVKISPKVLCDGLKELEKIGILLSEKRANSIYYRLNKKNKLIDSTPTLSESLQVIVKASPIPMTDSVTGAVRLIVGGVLSVTENCSDRSVAVLPAISLTVNLIWAVLVTPPTAK